MAHLPQPPSLGVALLTSILKARGHQVRVLQSATQARQRAALEAALAAGPDVVCISTTFIVSLPALRRLVDTTRRVAPGAKVILGGPIATMWSDFRDQGDLDIFGEGELTLPAVLDEIERKTFRWGEVKQVQGALLPSLDSLPAPDWAALRRRNDEFFSITTQRGCAWRCAFCSYPAAEGFRLRYRSVDSVVEEIRRNYEQLGITRYWFTDSTFTHPQDRCLELLRKMAELPFKIEWFSYARVDTITPEMVDAMVRSGCVALHLGMDSGDKEVLEMMRKGFNPARIVEASSYLEGSGIARIGSWVIGFPGETRDAALRTRDLILKLRCEVTSIHLFCLEESAPVGKQKNSLDVADGRFDWSHGGQSVEEAEQLVNAMVREAAGAGLVLGGKDVLFNFSTVGLGPRETLELQRKAQRRWAIREGLVQPASPGETDELTVEVNAALNRLRLGALAHPSFVGEQG